MRGRSAWEKAESVRTCADGRCGHRRRARRAGFDPAERRVRGGIASPTRTTRIRRRRSPAARTGRSGCRCSAGSGCGCPPMACAAARLHPGTDPRRRDRGVHRPALRARWRAPGTATTLMPALGRDPVPQARRRARRIRSMRPISPRRHALGGPVPASVERYRWNGCSLERQGTRLRRRRPSECREVRSVRVTAGGQLWMNGVRGLVQYDLRACRARRFGLGDGAAGDRLHHRPARAGR